MTDKMVTRVQCFEEETATILTQKVNAFLHMLETWPNYQVEQKIPIAGAVIKQPFLPKWELIDIKYAVGQEDYVPQCAMVIFKANFDMFDMANQEDKIKI